MGAAAARAGERQERRVRSRPSRPPCAENRGAPAPRIRYKDPSPALLRASYPTSISIQEKFASATPNAAITSQRVRLETATRCSVFHCGDPSARVLTQRMLGARHHVPVDQKYNHEAHFGPVQPRAEERLDVGGEQRDAADHHDREARENRAVHRRRARVDGRVVPPRRAEARAAFRDRRRSPGHRRAANRRCAGTARSSP